MSSACAQPGPRAGLAAAGAVRRQLGTDGRWRAMCTICRGCCASRLADDPRRCRCPSDQGPQADPRRPHACAECASAGWATWAATCRRARHPRRLRGRPQRMAAASAPSRAAAPASTPSAVWEARLIWRRALVAPGVGAVLGLPQRARADQARGAVGSSTRPGPAASTSSCAPRWCAAASYTHPAAGLRAFDLLACRWRRSGPLEMADTGRAVAGRSDGHLPPLDGSDALHATFCRRRRSACRPASMQPGRLPMACS